MATNIPPCLTSCALQWIETTSALSITSSFFLPKTLFTAIDLSKCESFTLKPLKNGNGSATKTQRHKVKTYFSKPYMKGKIHSPKKFANLAFLLCIRNK
jgi:hypothetical protein